MATLPINRHHPHMYYSERVREWKHGWWIGYLCGLLTAVIMAGIVLLFI